MNFGDEGTETHTSQFCGYCLSKYPQSPEGKNCHRKISILAQQFLKPGGVRQWPCRMLLDAGFPPIKAFADSLAQRVIGNGQWRISITGFNIIADCFWLFFLHSFGISEKPRLDVRFIETPITKPRTNPKRV